jgi:hypothetical protein
MIRDVWNCWNWWKVRKPQLTAVLVLGIIFAWMNVGLWQAERYFRAVVREVREGFQRQETARQSQFARLLDTVEQHLSRQDLDAAARREEYTHLKQMLSQFPRNAEKPAAR